MRVVGLAFLLGVSLVTVAVGVNRLLRPTVPGGDKALDLRVRGRPGRRGLGADPHPLLRLRLPLRGLRGRRDLPVPLGHRLRRLPASARPRWSRWSVFLGFLGVGLLYAWRKGVLGGCRPAGPCDRGRRRSAPLQRLAPKPIRLVLNWGRRYSLWVFNFGLACCAIEFIATSMCRHDFIRLGVIPFAPGPRQADLMVVSRHRHRQDGAGDQAALRADARAEVRDLVRRLLELRRPLLGLATA